MPADWTPDAEADLADVFEFIALDDAAAALTWVERIVARADLAALNPRAGRKVPELDDPGIREVLLREYRIIYRVERKGITVLSVFDGARPLRFRGS